MIKYHRQLIDVMVLKRNVVEAVQKAACTALNMLNDLDDDFVDGVDSVRIIVEQDGVSVYIYQKSDREDGKGSVKKSTDVCHGSFDKSKQW